MLISLSKRRLWLGKTKACAVLQISKKEKGRINSVNLYPLADDFQNEPTEKPQVRKEISQSETSHNRAFSRLDSTIREFCFSGDE